MAGRLIIGAMSGTSADGVDAALVHISNTYPDSRAMLLAYESSAYPPALRQKILSIRSAGMASLREFARLSQDVADAYAEVVLKLLNTAETAAADVTAIAAHGQTLFHDPPLTIQQFDPAYLAWRTGIDVISDFRRADCAAGGQGAPLVPFADYMLFRSDTESRVIVNIGGIANVTVLPAGGLIDTVTGFDVGPGNCLSDWLMRDHGGVDLDGASANRGTPNATVVERFLTDNYITCPAPKSTDGPAMLSIFQTAMQEIELSLDDQLATAASIVAECIVRQTPAGAPLILAGGGVHNRAILDRLRATRSVRTTDDLGVPAQAREAMAFAILGAAALDRVPANLPRVTGASRPVVLGAITPRP